jgi:hypothetical protein
LHPAASPEVSSTEEELRTEDALRAEERLRYDIQQQMSEEPELRE